MSTTTRITVSAAGAELLREMADAAGVTPREYLEALLHYAGSIHNRPGSWEANTPFAFHNYDRRHEDGWFADRWFN